MRLPCFAIILLTRFLNSVTYGVQVQCMSNRLKLMKKISIHHIRPEMILGEDIVTKEGRLLFLKNQVLTQKEIRTLKMWGITEINVLPKMEKEPEPHPELTDHRARQFLDHWFQYNDASNPVISTLYDICLDRLGKNLFEISSLLGQTRSKEILAGAEEITPIKDIHGLLNDRLKLPALPTIFAEINEAVQNPRCSGKDIAAIVSKDPSLSATLLKIVNSAYYGFSEKVESLQFAAMALGTRQVGSLALGVTVVNYFKGISDKRINMQSFWRHSVACAITAKTLAAHVSGVAPERVFIGGLLHDIGRLVFLTAFPDAYNLIFSKAQTPGVFLYQAEPLSFGCSHARFGGMLAESWNFSNGISQLILHHHDDFKSIPPVEIAVVSFSNWLVNAIGIGFSGENELPALNMRAWKAMMISKNILKSIIMQIDRQVVETVKFFYE